MFNDEQREIFSKVLDLNSASIKETDFKKKWELETQLGKKLTELKVSMGEAEYNRFMTMGKAMFAPINQEEENARSIAKAKGYPYDEDLPAHLQGLDD